MVRIRGVHGFGFVQEIIYCVASQKCVFSVNVTLLGAMREAVLMIIDPSDCRPYHSQPSTASKVYVHQDDHAHAALGMAA